MIEHSVFSLYRVAQDEDVENCLFADVTGVADVVKAKFVARSISDFIESGDNCIEVNVLLQTARLNSVRTTRVLSPTHCGPQFRERTDGQIF